MSTAEPLFASGALHAPLGENPFMPKAGLAPLDR